MWVIRNVKVNVDIAQNDYWTCKSRISLKDVIEIFKEGVANLYRTWPIEDDDERVASSAMNEYGKDL